jgi:hypothetical protein
VTTRRWVAAIGVAAIAVASVIVLLQRAPRRSGTDLTPNGAFVAGIHGGQEVCQGGELLPADTAALQMTIGTYGKPGPPITVTVTDPRGGVVASGRLGAGWRQGIVRIPITRVAQPSEHNHICIRQERATPERSIALAGDLPDPGQHMHVAGRSVEGRLRYEFMRPGSESWWQLLPTIVHRFSLGKGGLVRHWAWVGVLLLMLVALVLAVRTIVRAPLEDDSGGHA